MKKLLFVAAILFAISTGSHAQDGERIFKKFKGDVSLGYAAFPGNADIKNGFIFTLEPKYAVLDQLAIGGRYETTLLFREVKETSYGTTSSHLKTKIYQSFNITGDFYLTNNYNVRPFIGLGGGLFLLSNTDTDYYSNDNDNSDIKVKFGGFCRAGVEIKHFRIGVEYNFLPKTNSSYYEYDPATFNNVLVNQVSKNSYIGIKAGFCFGGGPKNRNR